MGPHHHNKLKARFVDTVKEKGVYHDGGGLYLQVSEGGRAKSWLFRYKRIDRPGEANMGLGPLHTISLAEARERARQARVLLLDRIDPLEHRRADRQVKQLEAAKQKTFAYCAKGYLDLHAPPDWKPDSWRVVNNRIRKHLLPALEKLPVAAIEVTHVHDTIKAIHDGKSQTAMRARLDLEAILDWAKARGFRSGDNPANWSGAIGTVLPNVEKLHEVKPFKSLPYEQVGEFMARLRGLRRGERFGRLGATRFRGGKWQARITNSNGKRILLGYFSKQEDAAAAYRRAALSLRGALIPAGERYMMPALLLEFIILTAVRSGQAADALWEDIDWDKKLWVCQQHKTRKTSKQPYIVVLSEPAMAVLKRMKATQAADGKVSKHIFVLGQSESMAGVDQKEVGKPATEFTSIIFLKRTVCRRYPEYKDITVHGFRKTFSSWANDKDCFSQEAIEMALGHRIGNQIAGIYNYDAKRLEPRRLLMDAWADHCKRTEPLDAKIIPMRTTKREGEH